MKHWNTLKVALHLIRSNSFSARKILYVFKLDHRWRTALFHNNWLDRQKMGFLSNTWTSYISKNLNLYSHQRSICSEIPCKGHFVKLNLDTIEINLDLILPEKNISKNAKQHLIKPVRWAIHPCISKNPNLYRHQKRITM